MFRIFAPRKNDTQMNKKLRGGIFVFLGACSFGLLSTIVKKAYAQDYNLGEITGSQTLFGTFFLWLIYYLQLNFGIVKKTRKHGFSGQVQKNATKWWKVLFAGTFTGLVGMFYYKCVSLLPASIAIILLMQYLWMSIILDALIFKKKPTRIQILATVVVLIGTIFAGGIFNQTIILNMVGIIYGLLAALSYALFILCSGRVGNDLPVFKKSALMITGSFILTWVVFRPTFLFDGVFISGLYKWGIALALLGTVIPPLFFSIGVPKVGISVGTILSAAELPIAVLSSYFILQENVQTLQWLGVVLILISIIMSNLIKEKK